MMSTIGDFRKTVSDIEDDIALVGTKEASDLGITYRIQAVQIELMDELDIMLSDINALAADMELPPKSAVAFAELTRFLSQINK